MHLSPFKKCHINNGYIATNFSSIKLCFPTPKGFIGRFLKNIPDKPLGVVRKTPNGLFRLISSAYLKASYYFSTYQFPCLKTIENINKVLMFFRKLLVFSFFRFSHLQYVQLLLVLFYCMQSTTSAYYIHTGGETRYRPPFDGTIRLGDLLDD